MIGVNEVDPDCRMADRYFVSAGRGQFEWLKPDNARRSMLSYDDPVFHIPSSQLHGTKGENHSHSIVPGGFDV